MSGGPRRDTARPTTEVLSEANPDSGAILRRAIYAMLIAIAAGGMIGRVLAVNAVNVIGLEKDLEKRKFKDLEKQALEAAKQQGRETLDEQEIADLEAQAHELSVKQRPFLSGNDRSRWCTVRSLVEHGTYAIDEIIAQPNWDTIDMVKHPDREGVPRLYSSKPPLLATLVAGEYWVIHQVTGKTLGSHPFEIGRFMLITINVLPMLAMFVVLGRLAERLGVSDWGRVFMMAGATFGTFLTTFSIALNNHLIAAVTAAFTLHLTLRIFADGERRLQYFALAGLFAAFLPASELPALSLFALVSVGLLWIAPKQTLIAYVPAAAVVFAAYFGTNYIAHQSWRPPYDHRSDVSKEDNWYHFTYEVNGKVRESYWSDPKGIDKGEPNVGKYVLHALVGHHGIFSLTPIWLLSFIGMAIWLVRGDRVRRTLAAAIALVSIVCITFYLARPELDRNYGGMCSGFRWVFWFAPLWLVTLLPAADWLSTTRLRRGFALVLLALSVLSVSYPTWNPWIQPWLSTWFLDMGWEKFG